MNTIEIYERRQYHPATPSKAWTDEGKEPYCLRKAADNNYCVEKIKTLSVPLICWELMSITFCVNKIASSLLGRYSFLNRRTA
jgi:hypothetical protein